MWANFESKKNSNLRKFQIWRFLVLNILKYVIFSNLEHLKTPKKQSKNSYELDGPSPTRRPCVRCLQTMANKRSMGALLTSPACQGSSSMREALYGDWVGTNVVPHTPPTQRLLIGPRPIKIKFRNLFKFWNSVKF
jgi:hypothetical protein